MVQSNKKNEEHARSKVRPLRVRSGVRYACNGSGLCCSDIHELGPLTRAEVVDARRLRKDAVIRSETFREPMLRTTGRGECVFLRNDRLCTIHADFGPEKKPGGCRRFPLGLSATPKGGRVTTRHCCPCRTLGDRPVLEAEVARGSLVDPAGRLFADRHVSEIHLASKHRVTFASWLELEEKLFFEIRSGKRPPQVLGAMPYAELKKGSWEEVVAQCYEDDEGTQFSTALAWFGDAMGKALFKAKPRASDRPWASAFANTVKSGAEREPKEIFADWLCDEIWSLEWTDDGSFARARHDMVTRWDIARRLTKRIAKQERPDVAAAQAVMIVDLIASSEFWEEVVQKMKMPPAKEARSWEKLLRSRCAEAA